MIIEDWKTRVPEDFSDEARVWIYQSNRPFNKKEEREIEEQLLHFYSQWLSHGDPVKGWGGLFFNQFIILIADEQDIKVSGCSTDSSVRVIKSLERQYNVQLFDRMTITFLIEGKPQMLPFNQIQYAIDRGFIKPNTLLF